MTEILPGVTRAPTPLVALFAISATALNLRTLVTGFTPLFGALAHDVPLSPIALGVLAALPLACFAMFGLLAPALERRLGLYPAMLLGVVAAGAGSVARAAASDLVGLLAASVLALAGVGLTNVMIVPMVKLHFATRMGLITGTYLALMQGGQLLAPLAAVAALGSLGWRTTAALWVPLCVASVCLWLHLYLSARRGVASPRIDDRRLRRIVGTKMSRSPVAWALAGMFGVAAFNTYVMFAWLPSLLSDAGVPFPFAGGMVALLSAFGLAASFLAPPVTFRARSAFPLVVGCAVLLAVGNLGLALAPATATVLWVALVGLGLSTFPISITLVNLRSASPEQSAVLSGFSQGMGYAIASLGAVIVGIVFELSGSWFAPATILIASAAFLVASGYVVCRPTAQLVR